MESRSTSERDLFNWTYFFIFFLLYMSHIRTYSYIIYESVLFFFFVRSVFLSFPFIQAERKIFYEWCDNARSLQIDKLSTCDFKYSIHLTIVLNTVYGYAHDFEMLKRQAYNLIDGAYGVSAFSFRWTNKKIKSNQLIEILVFDWHKIRIDK